MAGACCSLCGQRCFVERVLESGRRMHLATCLPGKRRDREMCGEDADTATNPHAAPVPVADLIPAPRLGETITTTAERLFAYTERVSAEGQRVGDLLERARWVDALRGPYLEVRARNKDWAEATGSQAGPARDALLDALPALVAVLTELGVEA